MRGNLLVRPETALRGARSSPQERGSARDCAVEARVCHEIQAGGSLSCGSFDHLRRGLGKVCASSGPVASGHVRSRWTRPCCGGCGQSRRAHPVTAVCAGHVGVARCSTRGHRPTSRWLSRCGASANAARICRGCLARGGR